MISTKQENATPNSGGMSDHATPGGSPSGGKPPSSAPTIATPCVDICRAADRMIDKTTARIAPGALGARRLNPRISASVPTANPSVGRLGSPRWVRVCHCCSNQFPLPLEMPSMPGIWPVKTWIPTPVQETDQDRSGQEVPEEPEPHQPCEEEHRSAEQCRERGKS